MKGDGGVDAQLAISAFVADLSRLERIHSGARHTLYRGRVSDRFIVVKVSSAEQPGEASLRDEYDLLRELDLPGSVNVLALAPAGNSLALLMDDAGETNLAALIRSRPLSTTDFLNIAVQLAEAIAHLHAARIIHCDIHPANIVWNSQRETATLCDFASARTYSSLAMESANPKLLEGTLPYMSPEQTGRTGRSTDWRTDLYSLGATFYQMLTGTPPFAAGDAVGLAHAQIARRARPPHEINPKVSLALSSMVLKLLEKEPEQRYQSATALTDDLRRARDQWLRSATIDAFPLASLEIPRGLSIPEKLYGRDEELHSLADAFERTRAGGREFVLVTGGPGIGKSALVSQLRRTVTNARGYYAAGKFDQLQRSVPFSGLTQALRGLVQQLLTESETSLEEWRTRIEDALAPNGQLMVAIVPELEQLLGAQSPVMDVGPVESKNRFHLVVTSFLRVFARPEHPLVLFLDDLQWVDAASLQLIEQWVCDATSHHLLVIGAYRDNEVGPSHALALSLSELRNAGCGIQSIHLEPLGVTAIAELAADTFGQDTTRVQFLADLIIRKSAGNPFFVRRLLHLMHAQGLFRFLPDARRWSWDESEIERAPIADNVLDLMVLAIDRLPPETRQLLETGACIGHEFELSTLAALHGLSEKDATEQLWPALEDGLLIPVRGDNPARYADTNDQHSFQPALQFAHDRVQQAAYGMLSEQRRRALHHDIGRRLLDRAGDALHERLFEVVDQLNLGQAYVRDEAERHTLIELNLAAGQKAKASAAYRAAFDYLTVAKRHLGARAWIEDPDTTFTIHRELAESAYLAGEHATAEELIEITLEHAQTKAAKADLYGLRVLAATVASDWHRALHWGREGLAVFGLEWPLGDLSDVIAAEAAAVMKNLGDRNIEALISEPDVQDEDMRAGMRLLALLGAPAYFSGAEVLPFLFARAVNLSIIHGPSPYSAFAFVLYGGIHNALTGQYDVGYSFGKLALALAQRFGNRAEECRTLEVYGVLVHHWKAPLRDGLPLLKEGFRAGVESGETAFAAFSLNAFLINALPSGITLPDLLSEADVAVDFAITQKNKTSVEMALVHRQLARALTGATASAHVFDDAEFSEQRFLEGAASHETALGHYWVAKLHTAYLAGEYDSAAECSREAEKRILKGILGMITSAEHVFYTALTIAALAPSTPRESLLSELRSLHAELVNWAKHCPENFAHQVSLVGAEIARIERKSGEALSLYRAAIDGAERERFIQDEALAHELRARFLLGEREPAFAAVHLRLARDRYRQWGATVKASALEREFPPCFAHDSTATPQSISIDAMALIKASQAISAQTHTDRLFEQILRVVVEVAGAQRGALILITNGSLIVRARIEATEEFSVSLAELPLTKCPDLSSALLRYAIRTEEVLLLADAASAGVVVEDPVVQRRELRSVLCVPLFKQATVVGLLYLENNALKGAFTSELVEVVQVLAAQAVISLENSTLLGELKELTETLEERVVERTRQLTDEIVARDKAQAELRELSRTLEQRVAERTADRNALWQLTRDLMLRCTYEGKVTAVNPAWTEVLGWSENDLLGASIFDFVHPDDLKRTAEGASDLSEGRSHERFDNRYRHRDGSYRWISWATRSSGGVITATGRDVTREIEQAEALSKAESQLRQSQKMEAVGQLTGGLAHDFNNLLAGISGALELMHTRIQQGRQQDVDRYMTAAQGATKRAAALTHRLLAFSRRQNLDPKPTNVNRLVTGMQEMIQRTVGPGIAVQFVGASGLWPALVDQSQLENALLNLCLNARDAMPNGGQITIETANKWLDERAARQQGVAVGQYLSLCVTDTGAGMSEETISRAFEPFFTTKPLGQGTGLGLSMIYGFAQQSGGQVRIYSELGQGTTVCIYLPRHQGSVDDDAAIATVALHPRSDQGETVLVVDDESTIRMLLTDTLTDLGYSSIEAADSATGLKILQSDVRIDLLITDVGLPGGMNGRQMADAARVRRPDLKVLFITGYAENAVLRAGQLEPGMSMMTKPFPIEAMAARIRSLIEE